MNNKIWVEILCFKCNKMGLYEIEKYVSVLKQKIVCEHCGSQNMNFRESCGKPYPGSKMYQRWLELKKLNY